MEYKKYVQKPFEVEAYQNDSGDYVFRYKTNGEYTESTMPKEAFESIYALKGEQSMKISPYQTPGLRNESDVVIQVGTYGK